MYCGEAQRQRTKELTFPVEDMLKGLQVTDASQIQAAQIRTPWFARDQQVGVGGAQLLAAHMALSTPYQAPGLRRSGTSKNFQSTRGQYPFLSSVVDQTATKATSQARLYGHPA